MTIRTKVLAADGPHAIQEALSILKTGGLVAFPTDTVYGVGALAFDDRAVQKLFMAKERDPNKAIPVLIGNPAELALVTSQVNVMAQILAQRFWPGALTLVVPKSVTLSNHLTPYPTIGVRMPNHPIALKLLELAGPLAVTSANISGKMDATTAEEVLQQLSGRVSLILDGGKTPGGSPSTVVDCTGFEPKILRQGLISQEEILAALG